MLQFFHHVRKVNVYLLSTFQRQPCEALSWHQDAWQQWPGSPQARPGGAQVLSCRRAPTNSTSGVSQSREGTSQAARERGLQSPVPDAGLCSLMSSSFWVLSSLPLLFVHSLMLPNRFSINVLSIFSRCPLKRWSNLPCQPLAQASGREFSGSILHISSWDCFPKYNRT